MAEPDAVVLGRVVGAHGLRGEIRVRHFGDGPESLLEIPELWLAEHREARGAPRRAVRAARPGRAGEVRIALEGVADRDAAEALKGLLVLGEARHLAPLDEGEVYWHELVGCRVETQDGVAIGIVRELWETGGHDVLVVDGEGGRQHLIPTARAVVPEIDVAARRIVVAAIPGLLDP